MGGGIEEQTVLKPEFSPSIAKTGHARFCTCRSCRITYGEETVVPECSHDKCTMTVRSRCTNKRCYTHCETLCGGQHGS